MVWAEENSRDAIFAALRRRETYATSGTRPVVRFFAGELDGVALRRGPTSSRAPTPPARRWAATSAPCAATHSPRFAVLGARRTPAAPTRPGTDLQRIQIVKGWVDAAGATHERVFDVAGDADNGAGVDPATCAPTRARRRASCARCGRIPTSTRRARLLLRARAREPDLPLEHARLQGGRRRSLLGRLRRAGRRGGRRLRRTAASAIPTTPSSRRRSRSAPGRRRSGTARRGSRACTDA